MNPLSLLFKKQYAVEEKVQRLLRFLEDMAHLYQAAYEAYLEGSIKEFSQSTNLPVIASGGVSKLKDIEDLLTLESDGVEGIIIGKALYNKSFAYSQTLELLERHAR